MDCSCWILLLLSVKVIDGLENLSRKQNTTASQSSTYHNASLAIDGNPDQKDLYCAHTKLNESKQLAWFQVDLGDLYKLQRIRILFRDEGPHKWRPYRSRQFYLDVSNTSVSDNSTSDRVRCYKDNTTNSTIPPNNVSISCKETSRYVIIGTSYHAPEDKESVGPVLEICEIKIYGCSVHCMDGICNTFGYCNACSESNLWGPSCDNVCSEHCKDGLCTRDSGLCAKNCSAGYWGNFCNQSCSINCNAGGCVPRNGFCINRCKPNFGGEKCESCDSYHFGTECKSECNKNCNDGTCFQNGSCVLGCTGKFHGDECEKECETCTFGCDRFSGLCDKGCVTGRYGDFCNNVCSKGCVPDCDQHSGHCKCLEGWQGDSCDVCDPFHFGQNCEHECSKHCLNNTCFANNGTCTSGCFGDIENLMCTSHASMEDAQTIDASNMLTYICAAVGTFSFLLLVVVFLLIAMRLRRNKQSRSTTSMSYTVSKRNAKDKIRTCDEIQNTSVELEDPEEEQQGEKPKDAVYYNNITRTRDTSIFDLFGVIKNKETNENEGFTVEFKSLPSEERFHCNTAKIEENLVKNRFKTTFPYDHSRVKLTVENGFSSDYINANYIENMEGRREYIACQGPTTNTVIDHWRMIWQEQVQYIVMLTNLIEGPKNKCHQYWPDEEEELKLDPFSVYLNQEKVYAYFVMRIMTLRKKRVTGSRTVVQFHYTRWPDHGTPNPLNLVIFHRHFRHKIQPSNHPILIHCSAGVGRTGTFIAFDVLSRYGKDTGEVNVIEYVKVMRKDRMNMIQNVGQYIFLYYALCEFFRRQEKYIRREEFLTVYSDLGRQGTRKQITEEYNKLTTLKPNYAEEHFETGRQHLKLNTTDCVLPVEQYRVPLTSYCRGRTTYYNAVTLSSFTRADEFISAQVPVSGAAIDLARLLVDQESHFLVSLSPLSDVNEISSWADEKVKHLKLDQYEITKCSQTRLPNEIRKTVVEIKSKKHKVSHTLHILECLSWSHDHRLPADTSIMLNIIKQLRFDRESEVEGQITVISMDGANCCGIFIAVYNAIEQLQQDDEVDICTIVQQLQYRRPEMISTKEEYEFCYKALCDFLNTDNVYANT